MDVFRNRQRNVKALINRDFGGNYANFSERIEIAASTVSRWFMVGAGHKNIGEKNARKIETRLGLHINALDAPTGTPTFRRTTTDLLGLNSLDLTDLKPEELVQLKETVEDKIAGFRTRRSNRPHKKSAEE